MTETEDFHKAKRKLLLRTCCRITAEVFLFLFLLSPFWIQNWNERIPVSAQNSTELPTLTPAAFGSQKNLSDSSYFSYYTSILAPVQYEIFQISDDFYLDTQYFQCQSEFLSESIGKTYLMTEAGNNLNKTETQTGVPSKRLSKLSCHPKGFPYLASQILYRNRSLGKSRKVSSSFGQNLLFAGRNLIFFAEKKTRH